LTVYVPKDAPRTKIDAIRQTGAELKTCRDYDEAESLAKRHGAGGIRQRPAMVSGRRGDERRHVRSPLFHERQDGVERAADFVRESWLKGFELEKYITTRRLRQPGRMAQRCPDDVLLDADGRRADGVDADQGCEGLAASRISASLAANAERAMTSSIPALRAASIRSV
jgi:hypothetical protein